MPRQLSGILAAAVIGLSASAALPQAAAPDPDTLSESAPIQAKVYGLSAVDLLNIRATASPTGLVLARVPNGSGLTRFECAEFRGYPWCRVELDQPAGLVGWTPARYINVALPDGMAAAEVPAPESRPAEAFDRSQIVAGILPDPLPSLGLAESLPEHEVQTALLSPAPGVSAGRLLAIDAGHESDKVDAAGSAFALALAAQVQPFAAELYTPEGPAAEPQPDEAASGSSAIPVPTPRPLREGDLPPAADMAEGAETSEDRPVADAEADAPSEPAPVVAVAPMNADETPQADETSIQVAALPVPQEASGGIRTDVAPVRTIDEPSEVTAAPSEIDATEAGSRPSVSHEEGASEQVGERRETDMRELVAVAQSNPVADGSPGGTSTAIPCARYVGQPMTSCDAQVVRNGDGNADVTIYWPDGGKRILQFRDGKPEGANTLQEFRFTREADLNMIRVGVGERFEILDAIPMGQ